MRPDRKNFNGCIRLKRRNYLLLYLILDDVISSESLIKYILRKPLKQSKPGVRLIVVISF